MVITRSTYHQTLSEFQMHPTPTLARELLMFARSDFAFVGPENFRRFFDEIANDTCEESTHIVVDLLACVITGTDDCLFDVVPFRKIIASLEKTGTFAKIHIAILVTVFNTLTDPRDIIPLCEAIRRSYGVMGLQRIATTFDKHMSLTKWTSGLNPEDARTLYVYFKESDYPPLKHAFLRCAEKDTPFGHELAWIVAEEEEVLREPA